MLDIFPCIRCYSSVELFISISNYRFNSIQHLHFRSLCKILDPKTPSSFLSASTATAKPFSRPTRYTIRSHKIERKIKGISNPLNVISTCDKKSQICQKDIDVKKENPRSVKTPQIRSLFLFLPLLTHDLWRFASVFRIFFVFLTIWNKGSLMNRENDQKDSSGNYDFYGRHKEEQPNK